MRISSFDFQQQTFLRADPPDMKTIDTIQFGITKHIYFYIFISIFNFN
jgi:hypothetical protein